MPQEDPRDVQQAKQRTSAAFDKCAALYDRVGPPIYGYYGRRLVERAALPPGGSVLDVATGAGAVLFAAAETVGPAGRVVGIDLSEGMVAETKRQGERLGLTNVDARVMDAEHLDFPDSSFDGVLCGFALFQFPRPQRALAEIRRVLRPGGRLGLSNWSPSVWHWMARTFGEIIEPYWPAELPIPAAGVSRFADPQWLPSLVVEAGFVAVETAPHEGGFAFAGEDEYWDWLGTTGPRAAIDVLNTIAGPAAFVSFKADFYAALQEFQRPEGLYVPTGAVLLVARKPAG